MRKTGGRERAIRIAIGVAVAAVLTGIALVIVALSQAKPSKEIIIEKPQPAQTRTVFAPGPTVTQPGRVIERDQTRTNTRTTTRTETRVTPGATATATVTCDPTPIIGRCR